MSDLPMQFPILMLRPPFHGGEKHEDEHEDVECFTEAELFTTVDSWGMKRKAFVGSVVFDVAGKAWRISDMIDLGAEGTSWRWLLNKLLGRHQVRYELMEEPPMPFEAIRDRVCASIENNPDRWRDDEVIAGEDGPPRDEQEMLEEKVEKARQARDMAELIQTIEAF
ncbi:hypothetical protein [Arenibaculum pallidiluteum]|uniref:hypothetical protein n=1 Tax=Arenibaculum pallidiluteum TaxID=2812559 RepID=UPI001A96517A|nr:hypothetical protein [Arenibaculum pallidiluteum]